MSNGRLTKEDFEPNFLAEIEAGSTHAERTDNPHGVTAEQIALGNVQNFGVASQEEAEAGASATTYMTPQRTKQAIDKNLEIISQSVTDLESQATNHESRLNLLESGASTAKADVAGLNREVAYLKLKQAAEDRIEGGTVFADDFNGNRFGFTLDEVNSTGFKIKNGKLVMMKDEPVNYNVTDKTVVASAYSTAGNGGRKLVRLSNGWFVAVVKTTDYFYFYIDKNDGQGFKKLCDINDSLIDNNDVSIVSNGADIHVIFGYSNNSVRSVKINALTQSNSSIPLTEWRAVDTSQTALGNVSLAIDPTNGHLHAAWSSKNATHPNSFNIRYSKSIDGGATWSVVEQVTTYSENGINVRNPSIITLSGKAIMLVQFESTVNRIYALSPSGLTNSPLTNIKWSNSIVYVDSSYAQSNPSAVVDKDGVIHVAWHGMDSVDSARVNIKYSKSSDGGVTWSSMERLTTGNSASKALPSITIDNRFNIHIMYNDYALGSVEMLSRINDVWSNKGVVANVGSSFNTQPSTLYDPTFSLEVVTPPAIYMTSSSVKFTGNWIGQVEVPTTSATVIYNIPSTDYIGAFVQKAGNLTVTAQLNDIPMESEIDNDEYRFVGTLATSAPATLRLELSRADTSNGENDAVTRILGGRS